MTDEREYFAVVDPDSGHVSYWVRTNRGLRPWPDKARYEPLPLRRDVPKDSGARCEFLAAWRSDVLDPWTARRDAALEDDPDGCKARFAVMTSRCWCCGRTLTDNRSKVYGIGPECRTGMTTGQLARCAELMAAAHGELLANLDPTGEAVPR